MISEPDTELCASEEAEPERGMNTRKCASKDVRPQRRVNLGIPHRLEKGTSASKDADPKRWWIVRSHISWRVERSILYKDVETSP